MYSIFKLSFWNSLHLSLLLSNRFLQLAKRYSKLFCFLVQLRSHKHNLLLVPNNLQHFFNNTCKKESKIPYMLHVFFRYIKSYNCDLYAMCVYLCFESRWIQRLNRIASSTRSHILDGGDQVDTCANGSNFDGVSLWEPNLLQIPSLERGSIISASNQCFTWRRIKPNSKPKFRRLAVKLNL